MQKNIMTKEEKNNYLLRFHRFQKSREKYFAPLIYKAIRFQYQQVLDNIHSAGKNAVHLITSQPIINVLQPLYLDAATIYGAKVRSDLKQVKARMPIGFSERMKELITQYFATDILNTSNGITETTKDLIREVFTNAYEIGLGINDIIQQLENTELSRIRARLIARTETVTAANQGAYFVAKDTGLLLNKEWLSAHDSRVRHDHQLIDGQIVSMDDYFKLPDYVTMKLPGARVMENGLPTPAKAVVNCRCTTLFNPVRENGKLVRV